MSLRFLGRLAVAPIVCMLVLGCHGGGAPGAAGAGGGGGASSATGTSGAVGGGDGGGGAPGAVGAPGGEGGGGGGTAGGGGAPGAPITIPSIVLTQGQNVDDLKAEIEASIEGLCDGALCVTVATDETDGDCLQTTSPHWDDSGNVTIDKSTPGFPSTLTLIGGPGDCPPADSTSPSVVPSEPTDTTSEPSDDTTSPADTSTDDPSADATSP